MVDLNIDIEENDGKVIVQDNEFSIVNDAVYVNSSTETAPDWLLGLLDNIVTAKITTGLRDYDTLVEDVMNAVYSIDIARNTYVEQSSFSELVGGIVNSRLETLNSTYENSFATKVELANTAASYDAALAQSISGLSASVDDRISAVTTNISTAIATSEEAISSDITTLTTVLNGNTAEVSELFNSINGIEASWGIETNVNGQVAGIKLINSSNEPSKFTINTDIFEVIDATTGDIIIGTVNDTVVVDATNLNGIPATQVLADLDSVVIDFNSQNNRDSSAITAPSSINVSHNTMDNGTVDLTLTWSWVGDEASIDGFAINMYAASSSTTYNWGSELTSETIFQIQAGKRSNTFSGLPSNLHYSFQVLAYRKVDKDINPDGIIISSWTSPSEAQNPYQPESTMSISANVVGTVGGTPVGTLLGNLNGLVTDFNAQNNRDPSSIQNPTILNDGSAIDHTINTDGSADISFEWGWSGDEASIDGFVVLHFQSNSSAIHTFGTFPSLEISYQVPSYARSFILRGVASDRYHSFAVVAYRKVDSDISSTGVITSGTVTPSLVSEKPYRPSSSVSFTGNITGTIDGYSASTVRANAYNGATFTSSTAGNLAYIDKVTTTYIEDLAVNRLKIQNESVGILRFAEASGVVTGDGSAKALIALSITSPESAYCLLQLSIQQGYNLGGTGDKGTSIYVYKNGSLIQYRPMGVINDTPCITLGMLVSSGTTVFQVVWKGNSSDVAVYNRNLSAYVSLR